MLHKDIKINQLSVVKLDEKEIDQAAEVLQEAFQEDPLMRWIFGSLDHYIKTSKAVFKTWITYCHLYGIVYRTNDFGTVAILKSQENKPISFLEYVSNAFLNHWQLFQAGMIFSMHSSLGAESFNRLMKFVKHSTEESERVMQGKKYWYLWMLGTKKALQGKGYGSYMLGEIDKLIDQTTSCYLEATSEADNEACKTSVHLYKRNFYKELSFFKISDSHVKIHCMEKNMAAMNSAPESVIKPGL